MGLQTRRSRHETALRTRVVEVVGQVALGSLLGVLIAWMGINWITGCGETTRTIDGTYIRGECVLVPWVKP